MSKPRQALAWHSSHPGAGHSPGTGGSARTCCPRKPHAWGAGSPPSLPSHPRDTRSGQQVRSPSGESAGTGTFEANDSRSRHPRKMWSRFCTAQHEPAQPEWKMRAVHPTKTPVSISTQNLVGFSGAPATKEHLGLILGHFPVWGEAGKERVTLCPSGSMGMQGDSRCFPASACGLRARARLGSVAPCWRVTTARGAEDGAKSLLRWDRDHAALPPAPCTAWA